MPREYMNTHECPFHKAIDANAAPPYRCQLGQLFCENQQQLADYQAPHCLNKNDTNSSRRTLAEAIALVDKVHPSYSDKLPTLKRGWHYCEMVVNEVRRKRLAIIDEPRTNEGGQVRGIKSVSVVLLLLLFIIIFVIGVVAVVQYMAI